MQHSSGNGKLSGLQEISPFPHKGVFRLFFCVCFINVYIMRKAGVNEGGFGKKRVDNTKTRSDLRQIWHKKHTYCEISQLTKPDLVLTVYITPNVSVRFNRLGNICSSPYNCVKRKVIC